MGQEFYVKGESIWDGMLADIAQAQISVELEQYSFLPDQIGRKFLALLEKKANAGVRVRLICDAVASEPLFVSSLRLQLKKSGMEIVAYNRPSILRPKLWLKRLHKKTLVIDSKIAWVGGVGIKDKFKNFRDSQVRITGAVAADVRQSFDDLWQSLRQPDSGLYERGFAPDPENGLQLLVNYPKFGQKQIYEWMRTAIGKAEKRIYISTAYFYPDQNFFQLLLNKAREGVDVRIILRGKDDEFVTVRFATSFFNSAILSGIKIYRYLPEIIHAKVLVIDDAATIGSSNIDKFSFYHNFEANIAGSDPLFVKALHDQFLKDLEVSKQIIQAEWQTRPMRERALEFLLWPFHNYL